MIRIQGLRGLRALKGSFNMRMISTAGTVSTEPIPYPYQTPKPHRLVDWCYQKSREKPFSRPWIKKAKVKRDPTKTRHFVSCKDAIDLSLEYRPILEEALTDADSDLYFLNVKTRLDQKKPGQNIRDYVTYNHGLEVPTKILFFTADERVLQDKNFVAVCDEVGGEDLIQKVLEDEIDVDTITHTFCTVDIYNYITKTLGRKLGQKKLLPTDRIGTIIYPSEESREEIKAVEQRIREIKEGKKIEIMTDLTGNIFAPFGNKNFSKEQLIDNLRTLCEFLEKITPKDIKRFGMLKRIYLSCGGKSGPNFQIEGNSLRPKHPDYFAPSKEEIVQLARLRLSRHNKWIKFIDPERYETRRKNQIHELQKLQEKTELKEEEQRLANEKKMGEVKAREKERAAARAAGKEDSDKLSAKQKQAMRKAKREQKAKEAAANATSQ